jgi:hypothetical protein
MLQAIQPPNAYLPRRNGSLSFASADPPIYNPNDQVIPSAVQSGRANNQGLEGLTISADGKTLYALTQSALSQDGGTGNPRRKQARLLEYKLNGGKATYTAEYVVTLPLFTEPDGDIKVAAQSEILALPDRAAAGQFLILARDSDAGRGQEDTQSLYRHADIFDISRATNIQSALYDDAANASIAADRNGTLKPGIIPATYCPFLDFNVNAELARFGLRNGGPQADGLLNEKWEALGLVPVEPADEDEKKEGKKAAGKKGDGGTEYFLLALSDNDFVTQNGFVNFGEITYRDDSGFNIDTQALVFRIRVGA